jgi:DNA-binding FadR family transcriptional regulator
MRRDDPNLEYRPGGQLTDLKRDKTESFSSLTSLVANPAPPRPSHLGLAVLQTLTDNIVSGELTPGTTLPTNPELCVAFGVSRTVVRESLKLLEEKGLVRVRQGQGTTVSPASQWNLLDSMVLEAAIRFDENLEILDDLVDVRVGLECLMTRRAVENITEGQLSEIHEALRVLESLIGRPDEYVLADIEYHDVILRASGNKLGRSIIRTVHPYARASTRYNPRVQLEQIAASHVGHVAIYERIAARDPEGASLAMQNHIMESWLDRRSARLAQQNSND